MSEGLLLSVSQGCGGNSRLHSCGTLAQKCGAARPSLEGLLVTSLKPGESVAMLHL